MKWVLQFDFLDRFHISQLVEISPVVRDLIKSIVYSFSWTCLIVANFVVVVFLFAQVFSFVYLQCFLYFYCIPYYLPPFADIH